MNYISVRTSTLRGEQKINFSTYIKINEKMILYLRQGDSFEGPRLKRLMEKKLRKMFILKDDENLYQTYLKTNIESAYDMSSEIDIGTRAEIIQGAQLSNVEDVFEDPSSQESYQKIKDDAGKYVEFILNNSEATNAMLNVENLDKNFAHHGVTVSTFSVTLAKKVAKFDDKQMELLAIGALLHDFGHSLQPINLNKKVSEMTVEEQNLWYTHTLVGAKAARERNLFDKTVINIINQHEEKIDGSGPLGLDQKKQDPLATLVASANKADRLLTFEGFSRAEVIKKLMTEEIVNHPFAQMQSLAEMIKKL